ncbi:hypothetical protein [Sporosarcina limicola]|uniref:Uncharacterized protein n=1 Tax=Sporosarcina limicola TaxID=34101 RepID=A0A927R5A0_9BACL|nr:hypothetical protein [Sporosarcina limicola]MBE1553694.1 hypothetical protein [Sporosarcina limicola]
MIPTEIENRIANYFFHMYLPEDVMTEIEDRLLPLCILDVEEYLNHDNLVRWAIEIIDKQIEDKGFK